MQVVVVASVMIITIFKCAVRYCSLMLSHTISFHSLHVPFPAVLGVWALQRSNRLFRHFHHHSLPQPHIPLPPPTQTCPSGLHHLCIIIILSHKSVFSPPHSTLAGQRHSAHLVALLTVCFFLLNSTRIFILNSVSIPGTPNVVLWLLLPVPQEPAKRTVCFQGAATATPAYRSVRA